MSLFRTIGINAGWTDIAYPEFPLLPAYAKGRGKEYVIFTDGSRVVAGDPARVKGKWTTAGVYWKYPSEKPIPRPQPNGQAGGRYRMYRSTRRGPIRTPCSAKCTARRPASRPPGGA